MAFHLQDETVLFLSLSGDEERTFSILAEWHLRTFLLSKKWSSPTLQKYQLINDPQAVEYSTFSEKQIEDIFNRKITRFTKMEVGKVAEQIKKEIENRSIKITKGIVKLKRLKEITLNLKI